MIIALILLNILLSSLKTELRFHSYDMSILLTSQMLLHCTNCGNIRTRCNYHLKSLLVTLLLVQ
jgi:hypothetical protein